MLEKAVFLICKYYCDNVALAQIIWLLNDEIVSSLRSVFPVTEGTLDRVTNHIRVSQSKHKMCQYSEVVLQFVFGPEKSLSLFIEVQMIS